MATKAPAGESTGATPAARPSVPLAKSDGVDPRPPPPAGAAPTKAAAPATSAPEAAPRTSTGSASPTQTGTRPAPRTGTRPAVRPAPRQYAPAPPVYASGDEVRRVGPLQRRRLGRLRARKVRRILRHVEVWSVLKVAVVFYFCLWLILLVSGSLLWKVATQAGLIDNVENFLQESGFDKVSFDGETMFRAWATGGFVMIFASTGFTVLLAVLFNLISDLMGGVRFSVIELETIRRRPKGRSRSGGSGPRR